MSERGAFSLTESHAYLGVSQEFFDLYVRPAIRIVRKGGRKLVPRTELDRWLAANAVGQSSSGRAPKHTPSESGSPKKPRSHKRSVLEARRPGEVRMTLLRRALLRVLLAAADLCDRCGLDYAWCWYIERAASLVDYPVPDEPTPPGEGPF